jgi:23S rRNA (guanosine2251-2'-O)-methyltransferase
MLVKGFGVVNVTDSAAESGGGRWLCGINVVCRRLEANPKSVREVRVAAGATSPRLGRIVELARRVGAALREANSDELRRLTGTRSHQGVAALAEPFRYVELEDVLRLDPKAVLVLDQIQDPHNLGALIRTAAACGLDAVVLPRHGAAPVTPAVERAATGAVHDVAICRVPNVSRALGIFKRHDLWSVGLVPRCGQNLFEIDLPDRVAIVLGGEAGLRPLVARTCDMQVAIPVHPQIDSLNASVAGAVAMYEIVRRGKLDRVKGRWY